MEENNPFEIGTLIVHDNGEEEFILSEEAEEMIYEASKKFTW